MRTAEFTQGIWIDEMEFMVPLVSIKRSADFLDASAERMDDGDLDRDLIGVYINYNMSFGVIDNDDLYEELYNKLTEPVEFHTFKLPTTKGIYEFIGYISSVEDEIEKILENTAKFKGLTCKYTSKQPARTPG